MENWTCMNDWGYDPVMEAYRFRRITVYIRQLYVWVGFYHVANPLKGELPIRYTYISRSMWKFILKQRSEKRVLKILKNQEWLSMEDFE